MNKTGKAVLIVSLVLGTIYFGLWSMASNGYGYMGYYGYHRGPSLWYWGGIPTYHNRDMRNTTGSGIRGGGPGSGK